MVSDYLREYPEFKEDFLKFVEANAIQHGRWSQFKGLYVYTGFGTGNKKILVQAVCVDVHIVYGNTLSEGPFQILKVDYMTYKEDVLIDAYLKRYKPGKKTSKKTNKG